MDFEQLKDRLDALLEKESLGEMRGALMMLNVVDIAAYMDTLEGENLLKMYRILPKDISADVFSYLSED